MNINIEKVLAKRAREIQQKMKNLEVRIKTGNLNRSISLTYTANKGFVFKALNYGKFQDEGTYRSRQRTETSIRVWPNYKARGRNNPDSRGITPLHFTKPMEDIAVKNIITLVRPFIQTEMTKEVVKNIKIIR